MDATTRFETRRVGALPVIAAYLKQMKVAELVDNTVAWEGDVSLGTLVEIMMCNRLLNPKAQYKIGEWAQKSGVCDLYGVSVDQLNDDLLGRALERISKHAFDVQVPLVLHVVKTKKLDVSKIHYDISSVELYGAYERQLKDRDETDPAPHPEYGRTKSGRKNVKQVQFGINVARDGAVPLDILPFDGNEAEVKTHVENLQRLKQLLPNQSLLYTADTKLDSPENLLRIKAAKGQFLCGGVFQPYLKERYLQIQDEMTQVDYCPKSKQHLPVEERPQYWTYEETESIEGLVDDKKVSMTYRLIFVWSEAKAQEKTKTLERHTEKIRSEFEAIERNLNKYSLKTEEKIIQRLEAAKNKYPQVGAAFHYELKNLKKNKSNQFALTWHVDEEEMERQRQLGGAYLIKTNLLKNEASTTSVLEQYKDQIQVERRIGDMKGPLAIAPMFLEKPSRIAGLMQILLWSLMLLALMERDVRKQLNGKPMYGIYPENRPCPAPTGRGILECFEELSIVVMKHKGEVNRRLVELSEVQRQLIDMMGIPPNSLRAFKESCCHT